MPGRTGAAAHAYAGGTHAAPQRAHALFARDAVRHREHAPAQAAPWQPVRQPYAAATRSVARRPRRAMPRRARLEAPPVAACACSRVFTTSKGCRSALQRTEQCHQWDATSAPGSRRTAQARTPRGGARLVTTPAAAPAENALLPRLPPPSSLAFAIASAAAQRGMRGPPGAAGAANGAAAACSARSRRVCAAFARSRGGGGRLWWSQA